MKAVCIRVNTVVSAMAKVDLAAILSPKKDLIMSQFISLGQAVDMTTLYRQEKENILANAYKGQNILARCETFERNVFDTLLAKEGCAGIRIYYGMDEELKVHAIVVAVNEEDEDMIPAETASKMLTEDDIGEEGKRCPDDCPPPSPLNP